MAGTVPDAVAETTLKASNDVVNEGDDLEITFSTSQSHSYRVRYKYGTEDGTATGSGSPPDYVPTGGYIYWAPNASDAEAPVAVLTLYDGDCEQDETFKIILTDPEDYNSTTGWLGFCPQKPGVGGFPEDDIPGGGFLGHDIPGGGFLGRDIPGGGFPGHDIPGEGWPCRFEAEVTIKQHEQGCAAAG